MSELGRLCVFCGGHPLTKEHVLRNALRKYLPQQRFTSHTVFNGGAQPEERTSRRSSFDSTVRRVCAPCNNGWMHDLEVAAEGALTPMLQGHPTALDSNTVRVLAGWAAKTAMMRSFMDPGVNPLDTGQMRAFAQDPVPPQGWFVFLGKVDLPATRTQHTKRGISIGPESGALVVHQTSFWLGSLFLSVVGQHGRKDLVAAVSEDIIEFTGPMSHGITRIWPQGQPTLWPGTELLSMSDSVAVHSWMASMFEEWRFPL